MPPLGNAAVGCGLLDQVGQPRSERRRMAPTSLVKYGAFLQTVFDFILIAIVLFLVLKGINKLKKPAAVPGASGAGCTAAQRSAAGRNSRPVEEINRSGELPDWPGRQEPAVRCTCTVHRRKPCASGCRGLTGSHHDIVLDADSAAGMQGFHQRPVHRSGMRSTARRPFKQAVDEVQPWLHRHHHAGFESAASVAMRDVLRDAQWGHCIGSWP